MEDPAVYKRVSSEPPVCTNIDSSGKYSKVFSKSLDPAIQNVAEMDRCLLRESLILDKLVYKYVGPFRREKLLGVLRMVNKSLKRYREVSVYSYMEEVNGVIVESDYKRLPSIAMATHLFQRLLRGSKCLQATIVTCLRCYGLVKQKLNSGVFVPTMLIFSALLGRIWYVSYGVLKELIQLYEALMTQASKIWPSDIDPSLPKGIKHLCPVYKNVKEDNQNVFTSLTNKHKQEETSAEHEDRTNSPIAMDDGLLVTDTTMAKESSSGNHAMEFEDIGEILTRTGSDTEIVELAEPIERSQEIQVTGPDPDRSNLSSTTEFLQGHQQLDGKRILIKPSLKDFTLKVYSENKCYKKLFKKLSSLNCVVVYMSRETYLGPLACRKLTDEMKSQNENVKSAKSVESRVKLAKKAAKRLERKISKFIIGPNVEHDPAGEMDVRQNHRSKIHLTDAQSKDNEQNDNHDEDIVKCDEDIVKCESNLHNVPIQGTDSSVSNVNDENYSLNYDYAKSGRNIRQKPILSDEDNEHIMEEPDEDNEHIMEEPDEDNEHIMEEPERLNGHVNSSIDVGKIIETESSTVKRATVKQNTEFVLNIPRKKIGKFAFKTITDKNRRKDFIVKMKSSKLTLHCGKRLCKPHSDWTKNVLILFKKLSKDLKDNPNSKSEIVKKYSLKITDKLKNVIKDS